MKCAERGLQCPGYDRNTVDAFFLDETAHVQAKAKKSKAKAIAARNARDIHDPWTALSEALTRKDFGIQITPSLVDQGISFFMSYYCIGIDQPPTHSAAYHKHLSTHGFNPLVATSMTALGIAGVANLHLDSRLKREATRWYLDAIKMVNAAISSPKDVKADSTLTSINLLSMFEATNNDHTLDGWINHVDGAASLLRLRGPDQFSTPAGQRLYLHTVGQLVMNCMGRGMSLPEYIQDMNSEIVKHLDNTDPRNRFFFLHAKCIDLRARILNQEMFSLEDMIESALELDREAVSIFKNQGLEWAYDVVLCGKQEGIFEDSYHVYPTAIAAQTWNWMRYNRIYFHDIIRNSILAGFAASPPMLIGQKYHEQLEESTQTLYKLQSDIIASMPQFLHDVSPVVPPKTDSRAGDEWPSSPSPFTPLSDAVAANLPSNDRGALKAFDRNFRGEGEFLAKRLVGTGSVTDRLPIVRVAGGYSTVWALYVVSLPILQYYPRLLMSLFFTGSCYAHGLIRIPRLRLHLLYARRARVRHQPGPCPRQCSAIQETPS
jgi:hypothetical protein